MPLLESRLTFKSDEPPKVETKLVMCACHLVSICGKRELDGPRCWIEGNPCQIEAYHDAMNEGEDIGIV